MNIHLDLISHIYCMFKYTRDKIREKYTVKISTKGSILKGIFHKIILMLCYLHHFAGPYHPLAWFFPIIAMPMILNCFCLSLLRTPLSRRGSRTVLLIYPHG